MNCNKLFFEYLHFIDQINIFNLSNQHQKFMIIKDLSNIGEKYIIKLTQTIIDQNKFKYVEKLNINGAKYIFNLNHLKNTLRELTCNKDQREIIEKGFDMNKIKVIISFKELVDKLKEILDDDSCLGCKSCGY